MNELYEEIEQYEPLSTWGDDWYDGTDEENIKSDHTLHSESLNSGRSNHDYLSFTHDSTNLSGLVKCGFDSRDRRNHISRADQRMKPELRVNASPKDDPDNPVIERKNKSILIRLSEREKNIIDEFAKTNKIKTSDLIRHAIFADIEKRTSISNKPIITFGDKIEQLIYILCVKFNVTRNEIITTAVHDLIEFHKENNTFDDEDLDHVSRNKRFIMKCLKDNAEHLNGLYSDDDVEYIKFDPIEHQYEPAKGY